MDVHIYDPDEWEPIVGSYTCFFHRANPKAHHPACTCYTGIRQMRRDPAEVARLKAERLRLHEDAILAQAEAIKARRDLAK